MGQRSGMSPDNLFHTSAGVRARFAAAMVATLAPSSGAVANGAIHTRLVIWGAFRTTSSRAVEWSDQGCGYRSSGALIFESNPLRIEHGPAVARVEFFIRHYRGIRSYDATGPAPYGRTSVQVVTARNAAGGVASLFYIATSGKVAVLQAKNVGRRGHFGSVSGTVHARLRVQGGSRRLGLRGTWHCRIQPEANAG
jgi:hypothetical protein